MKIPDILKVKRISTKFFLTFLICGLAINGIVAIIAIKRNEKFSLAHYIQSGESVGKHVAVIVQSKIENALATAKTTSLMFSHSRNSGDSLKITRQESQNILKQVFQSNPDFQALGMFWEPNSFDASDHLFSNVKGYDASGCFNPYWYVDADNKYQWIPMTGHFLMDYYQKAKLNKKPMLLEPHKLYASKNQALVASVVYPIIYFSKFYGITQIDLSVENLTKFVDLGNAKISNIEIITQQGTIIENTSDKSIIGQTLKDQVVDYDNEIDKIERGISELIETDAEVVIHIPISVPEMNAQWQVRLSIDRKDVLKSTTSSVFFSLGISLILLCIACYVIYRYVNYLFRPLRRLAEATMTFNIKDFNLSDANVTGQEVSEVFNAYKTLVDSINKTTEFADHIGKGNLDIEFTAINSKDILGKSLLLMRERLKNARQTEIERKEIERKQNWITEGVAKFNEILRQQSSELQDLGFRIIKNLITYIKANQGAIFILNNDDAEDIYLELLATVAYDENKYLKKKIALGEGLVGTCALEKKTIYQTKLPKDYISITSGLGSANPRFLLIVPLLMSDQVMGIIEIASFTEFEDHEIRLLEELAESLAATLATSKINDKTAKLLLLSREQAQKMDAQRKIMEKSYAKFDHAKKDYHRMQLEVEQIRKMVEYGNILVEFDHNERMINFNQNFSVKTGISKNEMAYFELRNLVSPSNINQYKHIKEGISKGEMPNEVIQLYTKDNKTLLVNAIFAPIIIDEEIVKILLFAQEIQ